MTEIVQRPGRAEVVRLPGHRIAVTGTMAQLSAVLVQLEDGGHLAAVPRVPVPTAVPGQYIVTAKLQAHVIEASPRPRQQWWQRRSWKFWAAVAVGAVLLLAAGGVAVVALLTALAHAAAAAFTGLLGALIVLGAIFLILSVRSGGTWTGSGTWR